MSECVCDFPVRLQGPAEATACVDVGESLRMCAGLLGRVQVAVVGWWLVGSGAQNGQTGAWDSRMDGLNS